MLTGGIVMFIGNLPEIMSQLILSRDNLSREIGLRALLMTALTVYGCLMAPMLMSLAVQGASIGWHSVSNDTCLMRPRLIDALCIVSRITIIGQIIRHF